MEEKIRNAPVFKSDVKQLTSHFSGDVRHSGQLCLA